MVICDAAIWIWRIDCKVQLFERETWKVLYVSTYTRMAGVRNAQDVAACVVLSSSIIVMTSQR